MGLEILKNFILDFNFTYFWFFINYLKRER